MSIPEVREQEAAYFRNHLTLQNCDLAGTAALARRLNEIQFDRLLQPEIVHGLLHEASDQLSAPTHART